MAKDKKSFVAYCDWIESFEILEDDEAGKLIKHLLRYVNDENPKLDDRILKIAFAPIKAQLKRDLSKYETIIEKRKEAGKKGGKISSKQAKKANAKSAKQTQSNESKSKQIESNQADNGNGNGNDNVNDILLEKETKELFKNWLEYRKQIKKPIKSEKTLISLAEKFQSEGPKRCRDVTQNSINNQWQGLFWDRNTKPQSKIEKTFETNR